jgi:hypothetical protein
VCNAPNLSTLLLSEGIGPAMQCSAMQCCCVQLRTLSWDLHWVVDTKYASSIHRAPMAFSNLILTNLQAPGPGQCVVTWC